MICDIAIPRQFPTLFRNPGLAMSLPGRPTFHSQSGRDAFDHVRAIGGMGIAQQLPEWQHGLVCKSRYQSDSLEGREGSFVRTASLYEWLAMIGQGRAGGSGPGFGDAQVP